MATLHDLATSLREIAKETLEPTLLHKLAPWVEKNLGASASAFLQMPLDDDWTFVIKAHAIMEAALNRLIVVALGGHDSLAEFVSRLDTGDRNRGKMAVIKALELLPSEA